MNIVLSVAGKFHTFDLARELHARGSLRGIFTGYPQFKLRNEGLPRELIHTFPWVQSSYMALPMKQLLPRAFLRQWEDFMAVSFGAWLARSLPECDLYVGLSGSTLAAGKLAHLRGARYICDRGSSHIGVQDQLLREEHDLWGVPFMGIDPRAIAREESEYDEADCITVPSRFVMRTFLDQGVPAKKVRLLPYGVSLSKFQPVAEPPNGRFDVLFVGGMSLRKGVQYLVQAFAKVNHPLKSLTFVGAASQDLMALLSARGMWPAEAKILGHVPQVELKNLMSRSHVLVLPSIEEGLAMVQAQAMACACPVVASASTGCEDLLDNGNEGFVVPARNVDALAARMQELADDPQKRHLMGQRALAKVRGLGGWRDYGDNATSIYQEVMAR